MMGIEQLACVIDTIVNVFWAARILRKGQKEKCCDVLAIFTNYV